jgi:aminoglycoside phosphotransferase (APT) family kinase protein
MLSQKEQVLKKNFERELQKLGLTPFFGPEIALSEGHRWYTTPCRSSEGKIFLFKAVIAQDQRKNLVHEIYINRFFKKNNIYQELFTQKIIKSKISKRMTWLLLEYIPGSPCGYYFDFSSKARKEIYLEKYANNFIALQKIAIQKPRQISPYLVKREIDFYLADLEKNKNKILSAVKEKDYQIALKKLKRNSHLFKALVLVNGDAALSNHILGDDGNIYLVDWEQCHLANIASDLAFLYIQTWRYPSWRRKFIRTYQKKTPQKDFFKKIFPLMVLYFSLREISIALWHFSHSLGKRLALTGEKWQHFDLDKIQTQESLKAHLRTFRIALLKPQNLF